MLYRNKLDNRLTIEAVQLVLDDEGNPKYDTWSEVPQWYVKYHNRGWPNSFTEGKTEDGAPYGIIKDRDGNEVMLSVGDYVACSIDETLVKMDKDSFELLFEPLAPCGECIHFAPCKPYMTKEGKEHLEMLEQDGMYIPGCCMAAPYEITSNLLELMLGVNSRNSCRMKHQGRYLFSKKGE